MRVLAQRTLLVLLVVGLFGGVAGRAEEVAWELRGEFERLKGVTPEVAILRLADGKRIEVPLESLSEASQVAARRAAALMATTAGPDASEGTAAATVRGPFGRPVRVAVPECIKEVEADAIRCRTAADAADVYRLFLVGEHVVPEQRAAAEPRLRQWQDWSDAGLVRLGDRWVPADEARTAAEEADRLVDHALELMRLGNGDLAEEELRNAARTNPESGRAGFVAGLAYALVGKNPTKALEHFAEVVAREPDNAPAYSNLAVLEILARRYSSVADHLRRAVEHAADPTPVADNVAWAVKLAGDAKVNPTLAKNRMPDKAVDDLNALYRILTQDLKLKPPETVAAPLYLGPGGFPCTAGTLAEVAALCEPGAARDGTNRALGFVIGSDHVICPRRVLESPDGRPFETVFIELPSARTGRLAATVVAAPTDGDVALLACDGLGREPLPLASTLPPLAAISAVGRGSDAWLGAKPTAVRGKVVTPALEVQARGRFIHTAAVPRGLGGGPIIDAEGRVVGMVGSTPETEGGGNAAGFGLPVERILASLGQHLPAKPGAAQAAGEALDRTRADRRAAEATVIVWAGNRRREPEPTESVQQP